MHKRFGKNVLHYCLQNGSDVLVAVLDESDDDGRRDVEEFRELCVKKLPPHLVPSKFVKVEKFAVTSNGKVDKKFLISAFERSEKRKKFYFENSRQLFSNLWTKYLSIPPKSDDYFVRVGGDSHLAVLGAKDFEDVMGEQNLGITRVGL